MGSQGGDSGDEGGGQGGGGRAATVAMGCGDRSQAVVP